MSPDQERHDQLPTSGDGHLQPAASNVTVEVPLPPSSDLDEVRRWALAVMVAFGLHEWQLEFTRGIETLGVCRYRSRTIGLSIHLVRSNQLEQVRDTLLHEAAHSLVGPGHGHDAVWRAKCREIGATPERCCSVELDLPKGRWAATCGDCGTVYRRHRRPKRMAGWFCRKCGRERGALSWKLSAS